MNLDKYFAFAKELGFEEVEFKIDSKKKIAINIFDSKVEKYQISENKVIQVRAIKNGNLVGGSTENIKTLNYLLESLSEQAFLIENAKKQSFFAGSKSYKKCKTYSDVLANTPVLDKINLCLELEKKALAYDDAIKKVANVNYNETESALEIKNSKGLNLHYKSSYAFINLIAVAKSNKDTRTSMGYQFITSLDEVNKEKIVADACDKAISSLDGVQCESKKYQVLFTPEVFASLLNSYLASVNGEEVFKGKSLLKDKLNQIVGSKKLTVYDDPFNKEYPFLNRGFDDEGVATFTKPIIENGVLKTFLYNNEAALMANTNSTGNGFGGISIGIEPVYIKVKPGKKNINELISGISDGVEISEVNGLHSGLNKVSGDFSLQASGRRIVNGKFKETINLITIAGNLFKMFYDIVDIGSDSVLTYMAISSPSVIIDNIAISGK